MATTPVTPAAAPPAAAPAAATASTSSAGSTGASQATSTPVTTHQPDGQQGAGVLSHDQQVDAMLQTWEKAQPAPQEKTQPTVETPAADGTTADAAVTTETPAAEATTEESEYNFDEDGFTGAVDLAKKLDAVQNLDPALRNEILANARIAEQLAPYRELFGSPDEAKVVAKAAQDFSNVQSIFQSITPENVGQGTSDLINQMLQLSAYRDENGEPRRREDGTYITDGTSTRFFNEIVDRKLNMIAKKFESDPAVQAAIDLVMERAGLRASTADKTTDQDPAIATERARLAEERKQFDEQKKADQKASVQRYTESLNGDLNTISETAFGSLLSKSKGAIDPITRTAVLTTLSKAVASAIKADTGYQIEKRALQAQPMTEARRQKEVALAKKWMAAKLGRIAQPILSKAGISVSEKAAKQAETQAAREQASRGEVTGAAPGQQKAGATQSPAQARTEIAESLKQKLGRTPTDQEINVELMLGLPGIKSRAA